MALNTVDRILTIVVTATLTSAVWIVAGGSLMEMADSKGQQATTRPAEAAPSPTPTVDTGDIAGFESDSGKKGVPLQREAASILPDREGDELMIPVLNVRPADLSDTFTDDRGSGTRLHEAIDIMAPEGTSVVAAAPGTIEKLFVSDAGGNTIYVRSPDKRTIHYYAHLGEYAKGLKEGQRIRRGQRLGTVGSSGNASPDAPHLHFAILRTTEDAAWWEPANALNPYRLLAKSP